MPKGVYSRQPRNDLTGQQFSDWTVLGPDVERSQPRRPYWRCRCVCGVERSHRSDTLHSGGSQGCGCRKARDTGDRFRKHGMYGTPIYNVWRAMHDRCGREWAQSFHYYGERGITVDPRWATFEQFYADMGDCPPGRSLERRNNDRGYSPENCYWATRKQQMRNFRRNHLLTHAGETLTMAEWAERLGMDYNTLNGRINTSKWSVEKALTTPVRRRT